MYVPPAYNTDPSEFDDFIRANSFAILVNVTEGKLWATHIPLELLVDASGNRKLVGHVSAANPQGKAFANGGEVLVIFNGPHSYISSSWYDFEEVPTWNYAAVHACGTLRRIDGAELLAHLTRIVDHYEASVEKPISVPELSDATLRQVRGIIGFEISVHEVQGISKFSQKQDAKNHANIVHELEKTGKPEQAAVAEEMRKRGILRG